jgi:hypothetical protein
MLIRGIAIFITPTLSKWAPLSIPYSTLYPAEVTRDTQIFPYRIIAEEAVKMEKF